MPAPSTHPSSSSNHATISTRTPDLTAEEKQFLKTHYRSEFYFLREQNLRIHNEDDRAGGRRILRGLMTEDENNNEHASEEDDGEDGNADFLADLERDPTSHVADYKFSHAQLDWIEKHYRHSGNFLLSYGLKPFDDGDCAEGVQIVSQMMVGET